MAFDQAEMDMIRRGDMLGPKLGAKVATALETLKRERDEAVSSAAAARANFHTMQNAANELRKERDVWRKAAVEAWNFDMTIIPQDRKVCVVWKDIYSDGDEGGPK